MLSLRCLLLILIISRVRAGCRNFQGSERQFDPAESVQPVTMQPKVEATLECLCCFEEKPLVSHCKNNHRVCEECTTTFMEVEIEQKNSNICCPGQCEEVFSEKDIKKYLGDEKYREYEALVQEQCINEAIENGDLDGFEKCPDVFHPF
jgi:hypothetical protein